MSYFNALKKLIDNKKAKICVVGLGYVGLPIAIEFAKKRFFVHGFDTTEVRIKNLKKGISYIDDIKNKDLKAVLNKNFKPSNMPNTIKLADVIIICVPTPLRKTKVPNISYIIDAVRNIAGYLRKGQLIVLESTTYPGTTRDVILPILNKSGLKESHDFFLSFSPERIDPGNKKYTFPRIPKIVGGISLEAGALTEKLYSKVINKVVRVSSTETAEVVKLLENTFRIVNIGLINEFAMLCDKLKINVWEVIKAAKTKPFGFMPFYPGPGIGGHCLPKDPLYLSWKARRVGFKTKMIDLASKTNRSMPFYVVKRLEELLRKKGRKIKNAKILILGVSYKKDIKDLREAPSLELIESLQREKARVSYSDPFIPYLKIGAIDLKSVKLNPCNLSKQDIAILITDHSGFNYQLIAKKSKLIFDARNAFSSQGIKNEKIILL